MRRTIWLTACFSIALAVACNPDDDPTIGDDDTGTADSTEADTTRDAGTDATTTDTRTATTDTSRTRDAATDGSFGAGIDGGRAISSLTFDEKRAICRDGQQATTDRISRDGICLWAAHLEASASMPADDDAAQKACSDAHGRCMESNLHRNLCGEISGGDDCSHTVAEWRECEQALIDRFADKVDRYPACERVTASYYEDEYSSGMSGNPEACEGLATDCEAFFGRWVGPVKSP